MPLEVKRKEGEQVGAFIYRFKTKVKQSGILKEAKKRRFFVRPKNKRKMRLAALHRTKKAEEFKQMKKLGKA
jgi:ribosomal protein S21